MIRPRYKITQRRNSLVARTKCTTPRIARKSTTWNPSLTFLSDLLFSSSPAIALWSSLSVELQLRKADSGSLSTSSTAGVHSMYCKRPTLCHRYQLQSSKVTAAALLAPTAQIRCSYCRHLTSNYFATLSSVQTCHNEIHAELDSRTPVYHGWIFPSFT